MREKQFNLQSDETAAAIFVQLKLSDHLADVPHLDLRILVLLLVLAARKPRVGVASIADTEVVLAGLLGVSGRTPIKASPK